MKSLQGIDFLIFAEIIFVMVKVRYQKQASTVRNMRAVRKTASCGTRRIFKGTRCKKQASGVRR